MLEAKESSGSGGKPMRKRFRVVLFLSLVLSCPSTQGQLTSPEPGLAKTNMDSLKPAPFTLVILPDTQFYSLQYPQIFTAQAKWIVDNKEEKSIVFVLHEGDITHNNTESEWQNANESISILDDVVPYALAPGNHDSGRNGNTRDTELFNTHFSLNRYQNLPTFGGVYEPDKMDNCYHLFSAGGVDWLILVLEFGPRDDVLTWANQMVADNPGRQVIILTHTYLYSDDTLHGSKASHKWNPHNYGLAGGTGGANDGVEMWDKLVRLHENISFVINGHILNDGVGRLVSVGDHGNQVYQILANYQMLKDGGSGWLRLMEFVPELKKVSVKTYSPHLDQYNTHEQHEFELEENVDFFDKSTTAVAPQSKLSNMWGDIKGL